MHTNKKKDMDITENPNPVPTHTFTCGRCSCKFECRDSRVVSYDQDLTANAQTRKAQRT